MLQSSGLKSAVAISKRQELHPALLLGVSAARQVSVVGMALYKAFAMRSINVETSVFASCGILFFLSRFPHLTSITSISALLLALLTLLAVVERLGAALNTIAVERDWVVVVACDDSELLKGVRRNTIQIGVLIRFADLP